VHIRTPGTPPRWWSRTVYQTWALADNPDIVSDRFLGRDGCVGLLDETREVQAPNLAPWRVTTVPHPAAVALRSPRDSGSRGCVQAVMCGTQAGAARLAHRAPSGCATRSVS